MIKVNISAIGKDHNKPSRPIKIGIMIGKKTPNIISLIKEIIVETKALPRACKKMKVPLFIVANAIMHK